MLGGTAAPRLLGVALRVAQCRADVNDAYCDTGHYRGNLNVPCLLKHVKALHAKERRVGFPVSAHLYVADASGDSSGLINTDVNDAYCDTGHYRGNLNVPCLLKHVKALHAKERRVGFPVSAHLYVADASGDSSGLINSLGAPCAALGFPPELLTLDAQLCPCHTWPLANPLCVSPPERAGPRLLSRTPVPLQRTQATYAPPRLTTWLSTSTFHQIPRCLRPLQHGLAGQEGLTWRKKGGRQESKLTDAEPNLCDFSRDVSCETIVNVFPGVKETSTSEGLRPAHTHVHGPDMAWGAHESYPEGTVVYRADAQCQCPRSAGADRQSVGCGWRRRCRREGQLAACVCMCPRVTVERTQVLPRRATALRVKPRVSDKEMAQPC
ncbi:hypothetical protein TREES_T100001954 [Tupaia chinensis]|uniref:Uncharacterized protein n=1 Tax=Tupaia chinensis TaxID=246437 RepID=L9JGU1_TUPCH|nr:hypothetical protein TREES_T100001954 [Tupaia chinensis]